ncbi:MAG: glycosyltransferase family 39 protein [Ramlibacter sp.]|jgi:4-amino-4-deoxy-L-arabinose transferase-like glycosyltransferase|nr:glycosyltransferase family 39 protein [Ramlibacter sp.]
MNWSAAEARRLFGWMFWGTLLLKAVLAAVVPLTGDEAFFLLWGMWPDWGYSDHPPMVGWWLAVLWRLGEHPAVLRSATLLTTSLIALGIVDLARRTLPAADEARAWLAGAIYLALPWSWMFVLVTTDTPLIVFMAASVYAFLRAQQGGRAPAWYALAGVLVGLAFLSKYFAALLGLAYAVYILGWRRAHWWALPLMFLLALPSIALNLVFNATHGWPNIMFNFFNRNEGSQWALSTWLIYLAMAAYLLTPWLLWQAVRRPQPAVGPAASRVVAVLWLFPMAVFALLAMRRSVGLHWVLGFVPLFVLWASLRVDPASLRRSLRWTAWLGLPHLLVVLCLVAAPLGWWQRTALYDKIVFLRHAESVTRALEKDLPPGAVLMARTYTPAAMFTYFHHRYVPVFGVARHHARQDDLSVDFRSFDGRPMRIFSPQPVRAEEFEPYFERVTVTPHEIYGVRFYAVDGTGFRFEVYRRQVLAEVARQFYRIPAWLPIVGHPFCERYGFTACSPPARPVGAAPTPGARAPAN